MLCKRRARLYHLAMRKIVLLLALLLIAPLPARAQAPLPRVLAFFSTGGEIDHYLFAQDAMRQFGSRAAAQGYRFAATSDWDAMTDANLKDVRLVIFLNGNPQTDAQRAAFQRYMDHGGAWLGFHISGFPPGNWPWYRDFLGVKAFGASNWPSLPARVNIDDPAHPVTTGLPPSFIAPINEWYSWSPSPRTNPDVHVLMTLDRSNFPLGIKNVLHDQDIPVAWTNTRYRMVYLNYGHGDRIYERPELTAMTDNAVRWLLTR